MEEKDSNLTPEDKEKETKKHRGNHMVLGMCFGMMAGSVGMSILSSYGKVALGGLLIPGGLFIGMVIGMLIPKTE